MTATTHLDDALRIVDRTDVPYETRLELLQERRASLVNSGAEATEVAEIDAAIQALEMGAVTQGDESEEIPEGAGHGPEDQ
ncbi:hypothetical protein [uncultured Amaricoccus sp.]|uniref:hypothetical protein n=1 Tax=uncultured Amaricoccus sp. TaxID=339341 RepID=UPI002613E7FD|nr:hypothetical protein [uncultured Amaricoccus sp.]